MQGLSDFAVSLYQQPEVAQSCLQLQNDQGCQVPVLLAYCWHASSIGVLPESTAHDWMKLASDRSAQAIEPLREARTWMKQHWPNAEDLRETIKNTELQLELRLLDELESLAVTHRQDSIINSQCLPETRQNTLARTEEVLRDFALRYQIHIADDVRDLLATSCLKIASPA
ncbi:TIGR02444 family protein [Pseudohongiella nitratireducens]|nr:TIGR02444 family protein [Pseudohongiella nitratireducens]